MTPSECYAPIYNSMKEKIHMSKIVIEYLQNNQFSTYEDLMNKIQVTVPPSGCASYTEDTFLRHAQFVVEQIESYDEAGDDDEFSLLTTICVRDLIKLSGVTLGIRRAARKAIKKVTKKDVPKHTKATTTVTVRNIFESFFRDELDNEKTELPTRRQRCGRCE
uniref:DNA (Cytosine-5)-methyltransferase PliMCI-like n=1 Tax=Saccoglossus kowalevskii TaxID=10224 RepID=A0ABM0M046_SACKO